MASRTACTGGSRQGDRRRWSRSAARWPPRLDRAAYEVCPLDRRADKLAEVDEVGTPGPGGRERRARVGVVTEWCARPDPPDVELTRFRITLGISLGTIGRGRTLVRWSPTKRGLTRCFAEAEGFEPSIGTDPKRD